MEVLVFLWVVIAIVLGGLGTSRTVGFWGVFLASLFLSPLVGVIILVTSKKKVKKVHRYQSSLEKAKIAEFKKNIEAAIDEYMNALYYLENDYKHITQNKSDNKSRLEAIESVKLKIEKLKNR